MTPYSVKRMYVNEQVYYTIGLKKCQGQIELTRIYSGLSSELMTLSMANKSQIILSIILQNKAKEPKNT